MSELCMDMQICHFPSGIDSELTKETNKYSWIGVSSGKKMKRKPSHFEKGKMITALKGNGRLMPKDAVVNRVI